MITVGALSCVLALSPTTAAVPGASASSGAAATSDDDRPVHSSDRVPGTKVDPAPEHARRAPSRVVARRAWSVAPGVRLVRQRRTDSRGPFVVTMLKVNWKHPRVRLNYLNPGRVAATATVSSMAASSARTVGAINGDFFDMGRTGAPLGLGKGLHLPVLHGGTQTLHGTLYLSGNRNRPRIEDLQPRARVVGRADLVITDVNSPLVDPDGIGLYTRHWAKNTGSQVAGGDKNVRVVYLRNGKVSRITRKPTSAGTNPGQVLVGRGTGATLLATLRKGQRVDVRWSLPARVRPKVAISGSKILSLDGVPAAGLDDSELHPRTAVGIDEDTDTLLMVTVDGRQRRSRGLTFAELGNLMVALGAEDSLNLDGGGSTTLVAKGEAGRLRVRNTPSDGRERHVANALQVASLPKKR